MKCVVLAAGEGKRMHPLTFTRPKVMLPVMNRPVLEWNLLNAKKAGVKDFVFVVGYKSDMVRRFFGDGSEWGVDISYVNQGRPLGTAHAVGMVESFVDDDFLVMCGDTIFGEGDVKKMMDKDSSVGVFSVDNPESYGVVKMENGRLVKIFEKMEDPFSDLINAGVYHFDKSFFDYIGKTGRSRRGEYEITDSINMMAKEEKISVVEIDRWQDVAYPWDLLDVNKKLLKENGKSKIKGKVEKYATLKGDVFVGENTVVKNGCYIEGPVVIGKGCKIGPNCYIRPYTCVSDGCHVGSSCEVKNSIVMDNSNVPHHNYVGDSVLGSGCNLGSGTKVANLRLDKKNIDAVIDGKRLPSGRRKLGVIMGDRVQTGVNSMFNVGSIVGNDVMVGPGAKVDGEVKPDSKVI